MAGSTAYSALGKKGTSWIPWLKREMTWKKELISIKVIQFFYSGGTNSILPYLTIHMKELGLTMEQIGIIYAFLPIVSILGPPISGMVADRTGRYKLVVLMNMILTTVLHVALLYLPSENTNRLRVSCGATEQNLIWDKCQMCDGDYEHMNFSLTLKNCEFVCERPPSTFDLCLHPENETGDFCRNFKVTEQIILNGKVSTSFENDTCDSTQLQPTFENKIYSGVSCPSSCPVECEAEAVLPCADKGGHSGTYSSVFWIYFAVRMIATFFLASLFTMMDAMTMAIVKQHGGEYGKQRFLFILGMATVPLLAGFLNDYDAGSNGTSMYLPAMYLGAGLCLASAVLISRLNFKVDMTEQNVYQDLKELVSRPEINVYFLLILIMGSNWGFIESYLFLYMGHLGSPNYLMGLTMTVGSVIGMPVMVVADAVVKKLGRHNIFMISFFAYAVRHFGYSIITEPWMVFPFELLEVFTYQLMWVAAVTYCPVLAPPGLLATMTGAAGAIHFSVGRGVGSFIGGQLIGKTDIPTAFRIFGGIAVASGLLYILLHLCYFKKKLTEKERELENARRAKAELEMMTLNQQRFYSNGNQNKRS